MNDEVGLTRVELDMIATATHVVAKDLRKVAGDCIEQQDFVEAMLAFTGAGLYDSLSQKIARLLEDETDAVAD